MESILPFVGLPDLDQSRHDCLMAHKAGMFKRKHKSLDRNEVLEAFPQEMRLKLDNIIDHINLNILKRRGYRQMPLHAYKFYKQVRQKFPRVLPCSIDMNSYQILIFASLYFLMLALFRVKLPNNC